MHDQRLLLTMAAGAVAAMFGCSDSSSGTMSGDGGVHGSGGSHASSGTGGQASGHSGGTGGTHGTGGTTGSHSGTGGTGSGGSSGMTDAGASGDGGTIGSGGSDAGGTRDAGEHTPASQTCTNPAHVLPLNPDNPQDGITLDGFYVATDTWNAANYEVSQTLYVCTYDNWYVVANMNNDSHDGAVKTYPNVHKDFNDAPMISSFTAVTSSFAHTGPHVGIYEFAYDIWLNGVASNGSTEIMIWTDNYNQVPSGSSLDTVTYDGRSYDVYKSGSYIAFVDKANVTSGTLDLLSFFQYVIDKGWIPATSTLGAIDYGVELVSTDGTDATFEVNDFSLVTH